MDIETYNKLIKDDKNPKYQVKDSILYRIKDGKPLRVIKKDEYEGVMYMMHDHELSGHFGVRATQNKIREKYYWKGMMKDIEIYVKSCPKCQMRGKPIGKNELNPIEVKEPFYQIGIDFVGPLPSTKRRNRYILVAMDYFTKWPEAKATKRDTAEEVVKFIYEDIICRHGCPQVILSDRGTHFNNKVVQLLMDKFNIKHKLSTSYHPQTNGLVERFNKTLCESLAKLVENDQWDEKINPVLFAYRNKIQSSSKVKPFYLVYGREARLPDGELYNPQGDRANELIEKLHMTRNQAREEIIESQKKQKEYRDSKIKKKEKFFIGEKVLLFKASRDRQHSGKLDEKWKGPYIIHEARINGSYKIKELDGRILKTPVNGELLKRYFQRDNFQEGRSD